MKKSNFLLLSAFMLLIPALVFATNWNKPDHAYFKYQKDIDNSMSGSYTSTMASITYNDKVFNFVNYHDGDGVASVAKVILRKLTNDGANTLNWSFIKQDNITNLNGLGVYDWQPAPVVFNGQLYLFVGNQSKGYHKGGASYSVYNLEADSWSSLTNVPSSNLGEGMAAVVINKRLCLVYRDSDSEIHILSSSDLQIWDDFKISDNYSSTVNQQVSAITSIYKLNGKKNEKLIFAIIDDKDKAVSYEYNYDSLNTSQKWVQISKKTISVANNYQSVALAEGTIDGDTSTGKCIQAFLKLNNKDNGYCRYRIQRYQMKDNAASWTEQENNLVPQTSPKRMWASKDINLTAVNVPVADGNNFRQYMCLLYRGYDDWDFPLNCAWAETDKLVYDSLATIAPTTLETSGNILYVGYIEGPPPFYLNDTTEIASIKGNPYKKGGGVSGEPISEIEYTYTKTTTNENEKGFKTGIEAKFEMGFVKTEFEYMFGKKWSSETTFEEKQSISFEAMSEGYGYYIGYCPKLNRKQYLLKDVHGNIVDTIRYPYISGLKFLCIPVPLTGGLDPKDPSTYYHRKDIDFSKYADAEIYTNNLTWVKGSKTYCSVDNESSNTVTTSKDFTWKAGIGEEGIGELLGVRSLEYKLTTTTKQGTEFTAYARLNEAKDSSDVDQLDYDVHWLRPVNGQSNWWLNKDAVDQNTWCITYDVTKIVKLDRKITKINDNSENDTTSSQTSDVCEPSNTNWDASQNGSGYSLLQNLPNPFKSTTKFKYYIPQSNLGSMVNLTQLVVTDINGNEVATLVNEFQNSGNYEVIWDASQISAGVYFYKLNSGNFSTTKKLILEK